MPDFGNLVDDSSLPPITRGRGKTPTDLAPFKTALTQLLRVEYGSKALPVTVGKDDSYSTLRNNFETAFNEMLSTLNSPNGKKTYPDVPWEKNRTAYVTFRNSTPGEKKVTKFYVKIVAGQKPDRKPRTKKTEAVAEKKTEAVAEQKEVTPNV